MAYRASTSEGRRGRLRAVESLAGWVFADMLLVLFLVGIGTAISMEPPPEPPPPPPKAVEPEIVGMDTVPIRKQIVVDAPGLETRSKPAQRDACAALRREFAPQITRGKRAAFVLVFGGGSDPTEAADTAERVYGQLNCASRKMFPVGTVHRNYWDGQLPIDAARVEVFVYTTKAE